MKKKAPMKFTTTPSEPEFDLYDITYKLDADLTEGTLVVEVDGQVIGRFGRHDLPAMFTLKSDHGDIRAVVDGASTASPPPTMTLSGPIF